MISRASRTRVSAAVLAAAGVIPAVALGQEPARDPVGAEELFRQGLAAKNRNDWQTACDKFKKSFDLDPAVSTQYKIANCNEHDGKLANAWYGYQSALKMNRDTRSDKRRRELEASIRKALDSLETRVPRLRIVVKPVVPGLELVRDGDAVAPAAVLGEALPVDPGEHVVVARAPGYTEQEVRVAVTEGLIVDASLILREAPTVATTQPPLSAIPQRVVPLAATSGPATQPGPRVSQQPQNGNPASSASNASHPLGPAHAAEPAHSSWTQVHTAYAVGAASVLTLLTAGYFGVRTLQYVSEMSDYKHGDTYDSRVFGPRDNAVRAQDIALILAGVGVALGAVSVGLYVKAPRSLHGEPHAASAPSNGQQTFAGLSASGRW